VDSLSLRKGVGKPTYKKVFRDLRETAERRVARGRRALVVGRVLQPAQHRKSLDMMFLYEYSDLVAWPGA